jgi:hypothetical protein
MQLSVDSMGVVREFLSKSIAGGLSAGVVLLWWPVLFEDVDTVTSWFVRGVAWTLCFELLLVALVPFERALWETAHGERIARRVGNAGSRLHSGSHRRRIGRLSAVATMALAVPVVLVVAGLGEQAPARAEAPPVRPISVVRVTKVVRPVTVKRVVENTPVSGQPIVTTPAPEPDSPAPMPPRVTEKPAPRTGRTVVGRTAPVQRQSAPDAPAETPPDTVQACDSAACGSSAPAASGSAV